MTPSWLRADRLVGDRYALQALIGRGGMGEVWRARHVALDVDVAIKFLLGAAEPSERAKRRFLTEARVTATLKTRYAVQVFDFGVTDDGLPYLVMELLEGDALDKRIAREGRLSPATTTRFLQKAARALEKAHQLGIVHRDFKPENVMLVPDEEDGGELVKVVDFGIAKLVGDLDTTLKSALSSLARRPGASWNISRSLSGGVGTPQYMAPEQVRDSPEVGPAADIWAFGVVAYECLTGRRPFDDPQVGNIMRRVLAAAPPPPASSLAPVPALFDDWFRVACALDPRDRFGDVHAAALALAAALDPAAAILPPPASGEAPASSPCPEFAPSAGRSPLAETLGPLPSMKAPSLPPSEPRAPSHDAPRFGVARGTIGALAAAALAITLVVHDPPGPAMGVAPRAPSAHVAVTLTPAHPDPPYPPAQPGQPPPASPTQPASTKIAEGPSGSAATPPVETAVGPDPVTMGDPPNPASQAPDPAAPASPSAAAPPAVRPRSSARPRVSTARASAFSLGPLGL